MFFSPTKPFICGCLIKRLQLSELQNGGFLNYKLNFLAKNNEVTYCIRLLPNLPLYSNVTILMIKTNYIKKQKFL